MISDETADVPLDPLAPSFSCSGNDANTGVCATQTIDLQQQNFTDNTGNCICVASMLNQSVCIDTTVCAVNQPTSTFMTESLVSYAAQDLNYDGINLFANDGCLASAVRMAIAYDGENHQQHTGSFITCDVPNIIAKCDTDLTTKLSNGSSDDVMMHSGYGTEVANCCNSGISAPSHDCTVTVASGENSSNMYSDVKFGTLTAQVPAVSTEIVMDSAVTNAFVKNSLSVYGSSAVMSMTSCEIIKSEPGFHDIVTNDFGCLNQFNVSPDTDVNSGIPSSVIGIIQSVIDRDCTPAGDFVCSSMSNAVDHTDLSAGLSAVTSNIVAPETDYAGYINVFSSVQSGDLNAEIPAPVSEIISSVIGHECTASSISVCLSMSNAANTTYLNAGSSAVANNIVSQENGCSEDQVPENFRSRQTNNPTLWKAQVRKRLRNAGLSYVDRSGVQRREKMLKPGCGAKCNKKCHSRISEEQRQSLFHSFWKLGSLENQRSYLARRVTKKKNASVPSTPAKKCSLKYEFVVDGDTITVCKTFFLHTIGISDQMVLTTLSKIDENGHLQSEKRHSPAGRQVANDLRNDVRNHINRFPTVSSHYCRKTSTKQYLPQGLCLSEMYRLYVSDCHESGKTAAKKWLYASIFNSDFNLAFHVPKKDQCDFCNKFEKSDECTKIGLKYKMEEHMQNKILVRQLKEQMKIQAQADNAINVACFDLQQVLITPQSLSSQLYYRRKLSTYNLTVFDLASRDGYCYMWHEGVGKRGANNIASCVWKYMKSKSDANCQEFHFFTDNCGGQNKNKMMFAMYMHAVQTLNVNQICHYYLERGHTVNEGDCMHSTIESAAKRVNVYTPMQWYTVAGSAKKTGQPYKVIEMADQMQNFIPLVQHYLSGSQASLRWTDIKCLKVMKDHPRTLFVKYSFSSQDFKEIHFVSDRVPRCRNNAGCVEEVSDEGCSDNDDQVVDCSEPRLHSTLGINLPLLQAESTVTTAKKRDLLWMCDELIIPKEYHNFYLELKVCSQSESDANVRVTSTATSEQNGDVEIENVDVNGRELEVAACKIHRSKKRLSDSETPVRGGYVKRQRLVQKASRARQQLYSGATIEKSTVGLHKQGEKNLSKGRRMHTRVKTKHRS